MRRSNRHIVYVFSALVDAAIIVVSFFLASWLRNSTLSGLANPLAHARWMYYGKYVVVAYALFLTTVYAVARVYGNVYYGRVGRMAGIVVATNTVGILLFTTALFVTKIADFSRMTLLGFYAFSTSGVILKHWIEIRVLFHRRQQPDKRIPVVVVGDGKLALKYADLMRTDPTRFEHVVGYVAPGDGEGRGDQHSGADAPLGTHLGAIEDLDQVLTDTAASQVVIALDAEEYAYARPAMAVADKHGVLVRLVPFYSDLIPRNPAMESVQDLTLVDVRTTALDNLVAAFLKRFADIVISALILILISPILLITAIGVRLSSPGPILYKQERIGKDRRPFNMLKFRSMRMADGPISTFTEDKDARKTKFGSFIRKYSIDELPQFINVLAGNMSIVGPRPVVREETYTYMENIPLYMLRYQVRPGITGWAQVNGYRGDPSLPAIEERTKYDLYYIEHWSPWLDVRIFFRTIFGGFMNSEKVKK